ncbi:TlpA disulfide reductase family protein [uncultured Polaribacter sp.]|uniref:TlpA family protein disulfide reductase n=1 Tax=uncultured Polaribacter sp. TaxID=174711 RepID=UPI00263A2D09|nr:TlpA disulfide reductase family protein [uncultured Polaribacter sp.]
MKKILLILVVIISSCNLEKPTEFSNLALKEVVFDLKKSQKTFKSVLDTYRGKKILIDVWASWCSDCIKGLPSVKNLQKEYPDVVFLFLSVDKSQSEWKNGIRRFKISGEHYNLPKGMKNGDFVDFINLNWIPRYLVVDEKGKISLFKATRASDDAIVDALNKTI